LYELTEEEIRIVEGGIGAMVNLSPQLLAGRDRLFSEFRGAFM
jgi:hypothetical protein